MCVCVRERESQGEVGGERESQLCVCVCVCMCVLHSEGGRQKTKMSLFHIRVMSCCSFPFDENIANAFFFEVQI